MGPGVRCLGEKLGVYCFPQPEANAAPWCSGVLGLCFCDSWRGLSIWEQVGGGGDTPGSGEKVMKPQRPGSFSHLKVRKPKMETS